MRSSILTELWIKRFYEKISCVRIYSCLYIYKKVKLYRKRKSEKEVLLPAPVSEFTFSPRGRGRPLLALLGAPAHARPAADLGGGGIGLSWPLGRVFPPALCLWAFLIGTARQLSKHGCVRGLPAGGRARALPAGGPVASALAPLVA